MATAERRAADGEPGAAEDGAQDGGKDVTRVALSLLEKVGAALLAGAGFVGFVAFTGSAVTWLRFYTSEVPATLAIGHVPRSEQLATGGATLVLFVVLGTLAVATVYAISSTGEADARMGAALVALVAVETIVAIQLAEQHSAERRIIDSSLLAALAIGLGFLLWWVNRSERESGASEPGEPAEPSKPLRPWAWLMLALLYLLLREQHDDRSPARPACREGATARTPDRRSKHWVGRHRRETLLIAGSWVCVSVALAGFYGAAVCAGLQIATALALLVLGIAHATRRRFPLFGVSVFFSVGIFGLLLTAARLFDDPMGYPVAILRTHEPPTGGLVGLYVAETDDAIWYAAIATCGRGDSEEIWPDSGRLYRVLKTEVQDFATGAQTTALAAARSARPLLAQLRLKQLPPTRAVPNGAVVPERAPTAIYHWSPSCPGRSGTPVPSGVAPES